MHKYPTGRWLARLTDQVGGAIEAVSDGQSSFDRGDARDPLNIYCALHARYRNWIEKKAIFLVRRRVVGI